MVLDSIIAPVCEGMCVLSNVSIGCVEHQRLSALADNVQRSVAEDDVIQRQCVIICVELAECSVDVTYLKY